MGTTRLVWHDGQRYTGIDSWGNSVVPIDGDKENGNGSKPSDLLPISLAACTAYTLIDILRKQRQVVTGLEAEVVSHQNSEPPWAFETIDVRFKISGTVDIEKARKALELAHEKYCSVSASLRPLVEMTFSVDPA
jgi:putative redox protein